VTSAASYGHHADPPRAAPRLHLALRQDPLRLEDANAFVADRTSGGVGLFLGAVRNHHAGADVDHLVYEAWEAQAAPRLRAILEDVAQEFVGVRALWVEHRLGRLEVGDVAVIAAASAPHRDEAMDAARALIDRTKANVPIWKHEHLADGTTRWPGLDDC
jgi:molybdopterin synthase catalytic subunit